MASVQDHIDEQTLCHLALVQQLSDAALILDGDGRILQANPPLTRLLGHPAELLVGQCMQDTLLDAEACHCLNTVAAEPASPGEAAPAGMTVSLRRIDGALLICDLTVSKLGPAERPLRLVLVRDASDYQVQQQRLQHISRIIDGSDNAIFVSDPDRKVTFVNAGFTRMLGYTLDDLDGLKPSLLLSGPHTPTGLDDSIAEAVRTATALQMEIMVYGRSGQPLWVAAAVNPIKDDNGTLIALISVLTDITRTKIHEVLHRKVLDAIAMEWTVVDVMALICREIEYLNPGLIVTVLETGAAGNIENLISPSLPAAVVRYLSGMVIDMHPPSSLPPRTQLTLGSQHVLTQDPQHRHPAYAGILQAHELEPIASRLIRSHSGQALGQLNFYARQGFSRDMLHAQLIETCQHLCAMVFEREQTKQRVHQLSFYDSLTGLPNRVMLSAKAEQVFASAVLMHTKAAVLFIDLDRFKRINDAHDHRAGDAVLREVTTRMIDELPGANLIARQAGDEFVVVMPQCSPEHAASVAERLLVAIARPMQVNGMGLHPSASIGVAMFPDDGRDIERLIRHADMAMHEAKSRGGASFHFYSQDMNEVAQERVSLESAMREAIQSDQFTLHYQPQLRTRDDRKPYGVEALIRWDHASLGRIPPSRFIPVAEECGLIGELSLWVLDKACQQMAQWRREGIDVPRISVNMSAINFRDVHLAAQITAILERHGLGPHELTLEITESVMIDPDPEVLDTIEAIYVMGVRLSLDDFGTGYSSLSHLHRLPIYELKLDQSFIRGIDNSAIARTLITSVLRIGESLSMKVVAEGVETETQRAFLAEQGFPIIQGFLSSPPLPADELARWWRAQAWHVAALAETA